MGRAPESGHQTRPAGFKSLSGRLLGCCAGLLLPLLIGATLSLLDDLKNLVTHERIGVTQRLQEVFVPKFWLKSAKLLKSKYAHARICVLDRAA